MSQEKEHLTSVLLLFVTAVLWSLGGVLIKSVTWHPLAIAGARSAIASFVILLYLGKPKINWSWPQIAGALAYAGTVILFVTANKLTTAANAILLQYGAPVYVVFLGKWLLNEKASREDWWAVAAVLGGMVLFFFDQLQWGNLLGNLIAVLSGWSFAFLIIFMRMQKDSSPLESVLLGNIFAALIGLPFMFSYSLAPGNWINLIFLGTVQLGLSYILYSLAIKGVTALEASLIPVIEPILNPFWVFLAIGETPGQWALVGSGVILTSIVLWFIKKNHQRRPPLPPPD
ncbi:MAG: hypothetical protein PWP04_1875 [Candidatus Atribacteria bacterium]|nr:hypothetical protein [Candidatus Atribacteria bacterium]